MTTKSNVEHSCNESRGGVWPCRACGIPDVWYTTDETYDGSQDVYNYHCHACGHQWRVVTDYD